MFIKQRGFFDFPTINTFSNSPNILTHNASFNRSFNFFPPAHVSFLKANVLLGRSLKKSPLSSKLKMFRGSYGSQIFCNFFFQSLIISRSTSLLSPLMDLNEILLRIKNFSSQPFEALKSVICNCSQTCYAFS